MANLTLHHLMTTVPLLRNFPREEPHESVPIKGETLLHQGSIALENNPQQALDDPLTTPPPKMAATQRNLRPRNERGHERICQPRIKYPTHSRRGAIKKPTRPAKLRERRSAEVWEVEKIVSSHIEGTYEHFYEVKWKGWGNKNNTWELKRDLEDCRHAIQAFEESRELER